MVVLLNLWTIDRKRKVKRRNRNEYNKHIKMEQEKNDISVPHIHDIHLDAEYGEWLESFLFHKTTTACCRIVGEIFN